MTTTELATLSMSELKAICVSHEIEPVGDKRSKATWVLAMTQWQIEVAPAVDVPAADVLDYQPLDLPLDESIPVPAPQQPPTTQYRGASIVMLIPVILLSVAVIAIQIGTSALIPLIAAVGRLSVTLWRFSDREDVPTSFVLIGSAQS
jgi:hypothetical protein